MDPTAALSDIRHVIVRVVGMPCSKTGSTHYHAQLRILDKVRAIKEFVVYFVFVLP